MLTKWEGAAGKHHAKGTGNDVVCIAIDYRSEVDLSWFKSGLD